MSQYYVTLKNGEKAIPLYQTRINEKGETEALVFRISGSNPIRELWILRSQIRTNLLTPPTTTESMFELK